MNPIYHLPVSEINLLAGQLPTLCLWLLPIRVSYGGCSPRGVAEGAAGFCALRSFADLWAVLWEGTAAGLWDTGGRAAGRCSCIPASADAVSHHHSANSSLLPGRERCVCCCYAQPGTRALLVPRASRKLLKGVPMGRNQHVFFSLLQKFFAAVVFSSIKHICLLDMAWTGLQVLALTSTVCVLVKMTHGRAGPPSC